MYYDILGFFLLVGAILLMKLLRRSNIKAPEELLGDAMVLLLSFAAWQCWK